MCTYSNGRTTKNAVVPSCPVPLQCWLASQVSSGSSVEDLAKKYLSDVNHFYLGQLALDGLMAFLAFVLDLIMFAKGSALTGILLFLLCGALGACTWYSYQEAAPGLRHLHSQLQNEEEEEETEQNP